MNAYMDIANKRPDLDPDPEPAQDARRRTAVDCETMQDVRYEIDRIDELIVELLAERQGYIEAAGRIKPNRSDVRDPARIEDVVNKVIAASKRLGLSPAISEPVWRILIEKCIAHEFDVFDRETGDK